MELTEEQEKTMEAARKGYEAYCNYTGGKSAVTGDVLPSWEKLPGGVKNAWFAAADAIRQKMPNACVTRKRSASKLTQWLSVSSASSEGK